MEFVCAPRRFGPGSGSASVRRVGAKMPSKRVNALCLFAAGLALLAQVGARAQALVSARVLSSSGPVEIDRRAQGQTQVHAFLNSL